MLAFFIQYVKVDKKTKPGKIVVFEKSAKHATVVMTLVTITYGSILGFVPIYAASRGVSDVGLLFTVFAIALLIVRPVFGKLTDVLGFDYVVIPSLISVIIAMIVLSTASTLGSFLLVGLIYGIGFGGCHSSLQTMAVLHTPRQRLGQQMQHSLLASI